ncbi:hypothetical protein ACT5YR_07145 [Fructobacillus fructosus]|uniref:hypothetical protein n=1 Tax=Fructobacillus fructosus TaxID=1631 RepID=UPI0040339187
MENLMFWNDVVVGSCLLGVFIGLTIFIKKAMKPAYTHNDITRDVVNNDLHDLLQKEKAHFVK